MGDNSIEILGITPMSKFPQCPPHHPCVQFSASDSLCLPSKKIKLQNIQQVCLKVSIQSFKTICTPLGNKLVIHGRKQISILFSSNRCHHPLFSMDFTIPFCTFILLKDLQGDIVDISSVVEDLSVQCVDDRSLTIESVIFICPVIKKDHQFFPPQSICTHCHSFLNPQ